MAGSDVQYRLYDVSKPKRSCGPNGRLETAEQTAARINSRSAYQRLAESL